MTHRPNLSCPECSGTSAFLSSKRWSFGALESKASGGTVTVQSLSLSSNNLFIPFSHSLWIIIFRLVSLTFFHLVPNTAATMFTNSSSTKMAPHIFPLPSTHSRTLSGCTSNIS